MQITRLPNESHADFEARAFRLNRSFHAEPPKPADPGFDKVFIQARPMTRDELRACGTPLAFGPTVAMSRRRAIWYGAGLVFGGALIAIAVFGFAG